MISSATPDGEGFAYAIRHHTALTSALGIELTRPPSDSVLHYFFQQVDVAALCAAILDCTGENHERAVLKKLLGEMDLQGLLIQADALHIQKPFFNSSRSRAPTSS